MEKIIGTPRELERQYTPIMALGNASRKPYIEHFYHEPENIVQQPLGTLFGYFEVREYSEESAYVVNFLNSVLKKEYFINPKRALSESLDAALHKVNVALSEIAKHGNINWLGHLDAAICVLEKNNLHFSVSGQANIILSRKETFNIISDGLSAETPDPHPLKTFLNVASGRLEAEDRLIITSREVFSLFTIEQLKKNNNRLDNEKFVQFLKTALINQAQLAHVGIVIISEKPLPKKTKRAKNGISVEKMTNVFSQQAFSPKSGRKETTISEEEVSLSEESEYTDSKTGHIYVQGQQESLEKESPLKEKISIILEGLSDYFSHAKNKLRRKFKSSSKNFYKSTVPSEITPTEMPSMPTTETPDVISENPAVKTEKKPSPRQQKITTDIKATQEPAIASPKKELLSMSGESSMENSQDKLERFMTKKKPVSQENAGQKLARTALDRAKNALRLSLHSSKKAFDSTLAASKNTLEKSKALGMKRPRIKISLLPSILKIKNAFMGLTSKQRMISLIALAAIIIMPAIFLNISKKEPAPQQTQTIEKSDPKEILANEKNISFSISLSEIISQQNTIAILPTENGIIFVAKNNLAINGEQQTQLSIPTSTEITHAAYMKDLSLVFLLTSDNKILSFSPIIKQFKENNIEFPSGFKPRGIATYLTYLYAADANSNQIYRYPRAEGGFGAKTDWLKDSTDLDSATSMTIDDSVFLAFSDKLIKFFKGKKDSLNFEQSAIPIVFSAIYTNTEQSGIYVLDKQNSRVIVFDKASGQIRKQYYDENFASVTSLAASEQNKQIYIISPSKIQSMAIE